MTKRILMSVFCIAIAILASCSKDIEELEHTRNDIDTPTLAPASKNQSVNLTLSPTTIPTLTSTITPTMVPINDQPEAMQEELMRAQKIIDNIMPLYKEMNRLIYAGLDIYSDEIIDEKGQIYFLVKDDKYDSVEDIKAAIEAVLTENLINHNYYSWVLGGDYPYYKNIEGKLCQAMIDAVCTPLLPEVKGIKQISENEMILNMQEDTDDGLKEVLVTLKNIDGNWKFDDFTYLNEY